MKTMEFCMLSVLLSMAAHGGISDALGASGPPLPQTPVSQSSAATPQSLDMPAAEPFPDAPARSPRNPNSKPMPAPAPTSHYAGAAENSSEYDQLAALSGSRRSISFFTTA
jgi:hypothetical protein